MKKKIQEIGCPSGYVKDFYIALEDGTRYVGTGVHDIYNEYVKRYNWSYTDEDNVGQRVRVSNGQLVPPRALSEKIEIFEGGRWKTVALPPGWEVLKTSRSIETGSVYYEISMVDSDDIIKLRTSDHSQLYQADYSVDPTGWRWRDFKKELQKIKNERRSNEKIGNA